MTSLKVDINRSTFKDPNQHLSSLGSQNNAFIGGRSPTVKFNLDEHETFQKNFISGKRNEGIQSQFSLENHSERNFANFQQEIVLENQFQQNLFSEHNQQEKIIQMQSPDSEQQFSSPLRYRNHNVSAYTIKEQLLLYSIIKRLLGKSETQKQLQVQQYITSFVHKIRGQARMYNIENLSDYHFKMINDSSSCRKGVNSEAVHQQRFKRTMMTRPENPNIFHKVVFYKYICYSFKVQQWIVKCITEYKIILRNTLDGFNKNYCILAMPVLSNESQFLIAFNMVHILAILFTLIYLSLTLLFPKSDFQISQVINISVITVYCLAILLKFNLQFVHKGELIQDRVEIITKYITKKKDKLGFLLDGLSTVGFILVQIEGYDYFFLVLFLILTGFFKMKGIVKRLENRFSLDIKGDPKNYWELIKLFSSILLIAHFLNCLWIIAGNHSEERFQWSWISSKNILQDDYLSIYVYGLYFILMTMTTIGYGDILPTNVYETLVTLVIMVLITTSISYIKLVSSAIFGYTFNGINQIINQMNYSQETYQEQKDLISNYMNKRQIKNDLQRTILNYFDFAWQNGMFDQLEKQKTVISKLSAPLQEALQLQDKGRVLENIPLFKKHFSQALIRKLNLQIKEFHFSPNDIIRDNLVDQEGQGLLHVQSGKVQLVYNGQLIQEYQEKCSLCIDLLFRPERLKYQLRAQTFTTLYLLSREDFISTIRQPAFTQDYEVYCMLKDQLQFNSEDSLQKNKCYSCSEDNHQTLSCPLISYVPNKPQAIQKSQYCPTQKRFKEWNRKRIKQNSRLLLLKMKNLLFDEEENTKKLIQLQSMSLDESIKRTHSIQLIQLERFSEKNLELNNPEFKTSLKQQLNRSSLLKQTISEALDLDLLRTYNNYFPSQNVSTILKKLPKPKQNKKSLPMLIKEQRERHSLLRLK